MRYALTILSVLVLSAVAFAGPKSGFPHGKEKHRAVDCVKCHRLTIGAPEVKRFPGHTACSSCHNFGNEALKNTERFCGICHNATPESVQKPALFKFPKTTVPTDFGYVFSHVGHLKPLPENPSLMQPFLSGQPPTCTNCHHASANRADYSSDFGHLACFPCHGEKPVAAPAYNECAKCHLVSGERLASLIDSVKKFTHAEHSIDIRSKKKAELANYRRPDFLCFDCHSSVATSTTLPAVHLPSEEYCNSCHNGKIGLPDPLAVEIVASIKTRS